MASTWYAATIIMQVKVEGEDDKLFTCFEQIHLVRAVDREVAYEKSLRLGKSEGKSYKNMYGKSVSWGFIGLANLEEILDNPLKDGTEIRSRRLRVGDPRELVRDRDELTVFAFDKYHNMTALEIISEDE